MLVRLIEVAIFTTLSFFFPIQSLVCAVAYYGCSVCNRISENRIQIKLSIEGLTNAIRQKKS